MNTKGKTDEQITVEYLLEYINAQVKKTCKNAKVVVGEPIGFKWNGENTELPVYIKFNDYKSHLCNVKPGVFDIYDNSNTITSCLSDDNHIDVIEKATERICKCLLCREEVCNKMHEIVTDCVYRCGSNETVFVINNSTNRDFMPYIVVVKSTVVVSIGDQNAIRVRGVDTCAENISENIEDAVRDVLEHRRCG